MSAFKLPAIIMAYTGLALISGIWDLWSRGSFFYSWAQSDLNSVLWIVVAVVFIAFYLALSEFVGRITQWGQQLYALISKLLTPISYFEALVIALLSGFVEEWFFRGILLSHFGVVVSSLLFGLAHLIIAGRLWIWSLWTFFFGLFFAWLMNQSGSLFLCAAVHAVINAVLLVILNHRSQAKSELFVAKSSY